MEIEIDTEAIVNRNIERLWRTGVVAVNPTPECTELGFLRPYSVNPTRFQECPVEWKGAVEDLTDVIIYSLGKEIDKIDRITGGNLNGALFSMPVAVRLGKKHAYIFENGIICGDVKKGEQILHIEDYLLQPMQVYDPEQRLSDGSGVQLTLGAAGCDLVDFFCFMTASENVLEEVGQRVFAEAMVRIDYEFLMIGLNKGLISREGFESVVSYDKDPVKWGVEFLREHPEYLVKRMDPDNCDNMQVLAENVLKVYAGLENGRFAEDVAQIETRIRKMCREKYGTLEDEGEPDTAKVLSLDSRRPR